MSRCPVDLLNKHANAMAALHGVDNSMDQVLSAISDLSALAFREAHISNMGIGFNDLGAISTAAENVLRAIELSAPLTVKGMQ